MFKPVKILDEKDPKLRKENIDVEFPLSKDEKKIIQNMIDHLTYSQIEELSIKYDLRPGMGLAAPQVGINKNFFVVVHEVEEGIFDNYVIINPKIISHSEELIYASTGEGCLSVERDIEGIVPRYARIKIEGFDENGNKITVRGREELSIAFQHEYDHLKGILFMDRIDKNDPFKDQNKMRMI